MNSHEFSYDKLDQSLLKALNNNDAIFDFLVCGFFVGGFGCRG